MFPHIFSFTACGIRCAVRAVEKVTLEPFFSVYGPMISSGGESVLSYDVNFSSGQQFTFSRTDTTPIVAENIGELLFCFDKDLTIELQKHRSDLYFVHSAVLSFGEHACLICGPSGRGKSTLTWALMHHGMSYLSDELAPISLDTMQVLPFPRALSLKREPPAPYRVGDRGLRTEWSHYVAAAQMPGAVVTGGEHRIKAFFYLEQREKLAPGTGICEPMSKGEACMHLYANALNQLAHPASGLKAAHAIVRDIACYRLGVGDLDAMCKAVTSAMRG